METNEFSIGDKVELIDDTYSDFGLKKGATGTIKWFAYDTVAVRFDNYHMGHSCDGVISGCRVGFWVFPKFLKLID